MHKNRNRIARLLMTSVIAAPFLATSDFMATTPVEMSIQQDIVELSSGLKVSGRENIEWHYANGVLSILPCSSDIYLSGSAKSDIIKVSPDFNGRIILSGVELGTSLDLPNLDIGVAANTVNKITSSDLGLNCDTLYGMGSNAKLIVNSAKSGVQASTIIRDLDLTINAGEFGVLANKLNNVKLTCNASTCVTSARPGCSITNCTMNLKAAENGIAYDGDMEIINGTYNISGKNGIIVTGDSYSRYLKLNNAGVDLKCTNVGVGVVDGRRERIDVSNTEVNNLESCKAIIGYANSSKNQAPNIETINSSVISAKPVSVGIGYLTESIGTNTSINLGDSNINLIANDVGIGSVANDTLSQILNYGGVTEITSPNGLGVGNVTGKNCYVEFVGSNIAVISAKIPDNCIFGGTSIVNKGKEKLDYNINGKVIELYGDHKISKDGLIIVISSEHKVIADNIIVHDPAKPHATGLEVNGILEVRPGKVINNLKGLLNNGTIYGKVIGEGQITGDGKVIERDYSGNQAPTNPSINIIVEPTTSNKYGDVYVKFELNHSLDPEGDAITYTYEGPHKNGYYKPGKYTTKVYAEDSHGAKSGVYEITFEVPDVRQKPVKPFFDIVMGKYNDKGECLVKLLPVDATEDLTYEFIGKPADDYYKPGKYVVKGRSKSVNGLYSDWRILEFEVPANPDSAKPSTPEIKATVTNDYDIDGRCLVKIDLVKPSDGKDVRYEYIGLSHDGRYEAGKYRVSVRAVDANNQYSDWYHLEFEVPEENKAPAKPELTVAVTDRYNSKGECLVKVVLAKPAVDPEGQKVTYEYEGLGVGNHYYKPGTYSIRVRAKDSAGKYSEWFNVMFVVPQKNDFNINITTHETLMGKDRYETAVKITNETKTNKLIVFNASKSIVDGLSASALAGKLNANVLPINPNKMSEETLKVIKKADEVYIMGLYDAVPKKFESNIKGKVVRIGGKDRYETSKKVAEHIGNYHKAFLVNGEIGQADAMSISPVAARDKAPILLVNNNRNIFTPERGVKYTAIGGTKVMPARYINVFNANRLGGSDRYATNRRVLETYYGWKNKIYFCNGETLVDALSGSYLARDYGIALVNKNTNHYLLNGKNTVQLGGLNFKVEHK